MNQKTWRHWSEHPIDHDMLAAALMRAGFAEFVAQAMAMPAPLLTREELADRLRVRPAQVDKFARLGMPRRFVGSLPRFDHAECRRWLQDHEAPRVRVPSSGARPVPGVHRVPSRRGSAV